MAATPPENNGFGFVFNWGVVEWMITGIISSGVAVAGWVWGLNSQIQKLVAENERLRDTIERLELRSVKQETEMELLQQTVHQQNLDNAVGREKLRGDLLERIAALPTQKFLEERLNQQTARLDELIRRSSRD